jgi:hypothetical protein
LLGVLLQNFVDSALRKTDGVGPVKAAASSAPLFI